MRSACNGDVAEDKRVIRGLEGRGDEVVYATRISW